jgi:hypothetical protein
MPPVAAPMQRQQLPFRRDTHYLLEAGSLKATPHQYDAQRFPDACWP